MDKSRILIVDDHTVVRKGIGQILSGEADMAVVAEAQGGLEAIEKTRNLNPDIVLMDIAMPDLNGLEALRMIKEAASETAVVILSMHAKASYVHQALAAGALGYVLKDSPSKDILEAVRAARQGEHYLSPRIQAGVIDTYLKNKDSKPASSGYDLLTEREQQVFRLVAEGMSTQKIAEILFVSPKTVEKHRSNVMNKLNVNDRLDLLKYAIRIGIVDTDLWDG